MSVNYSFWPLANYIAKLFRSITRYLTQSGGGFNRYIRQYEDGYEEEVRTMTEPLTKSGGGFNSYEDDGREGEEARTMTPGAMIREIARVRATVEELSSSLAQIEAALTAIFSSPPQPRKRSTNKPSSSDPFASTVARSASARKTSPGKESKDAPAEKPETEKTGYAAYIDDPEHLALIDKFKESPFNYANNMTVEELATFYSIVEILKSNKVSPQHLNIPCPNMDAWDAILGTITAHLERYGSSAAHRYM